MSVNEMFTMNLKLLSACLLCLSCGSLSAEIYKYQDLAGKWHFSDKKPQEHIGSSVESLKYIKTKAVHIRPYLKLGFTDGRIQYRVHNPYHALVQCFLRFDDDFGLKTIDKLIEPESKKILYESGLNAKKRAYDFRCVTGDPENKPDIKQVRPPFGGHKPMKITQAFKGPFSHNHQPSLYAVDIAMPVSTKIVAVKSGVVISTKDDYAAAGVSSPFFFDKANYIDIMHDDGTYAIYAHLLLGSIKVRKGQTVRAGQFIALSGNTGYSTGPHLHFAIRYNAKGWTKSLPFKFTQSGKKPMTPKRGLWLLPDREPDS